VVKRGGRSKMIAKSLVEEVVAKSLVEVRWLQRGRSRSGCKEPGRSKMVAKRS
jgi:hypothetical protein